LYGFNTIVCSKTYRKILFDETLYVNIAIAYFQEQKKIPYG
jgi:hypothetical protein